MLVAAALATSKFAYDLAKAKLPTQAVTASCPDLTHGCRLEVAGRSIDVRMSPAPVVLTPFTLTVKAPAARQVTAEFAMVGMDMGLNRYQLQAAGKGSWQARVMLPVCVAGGSDWVMLLELDGAKVRVPFTAKKLS